MKLFKLILFFGILVLSTKLSAQDDGLLRHKAQLNTQPHGTITEFKLADPEITGSEYLVEAWNMADVTLKNGIELKEKLIKYDLENHLIEIKVDEKVKVIDESKVKKFKWLNTENAEREEFLNGSSFTLNGSILLGFFKLEFDGAQRLLSYTNLRLQKANYVPALNSGEKNDKLVKETTLYIEKDKTLYKVPKSRKKFMELKVFEKNRDEVLKHIKSNNLSIRQKGDLIEVVKFASMH